MGDMRVGLYYCPCGMDELGGGLDEAEMARRLVGVNGIAWFERIDFACSVEGRARLEAHLRALKPDRVVLTVCSVRDQEETFRGVLSRAGLNPWQMRLVNVREHIAWVTDDPRRATEKAVAALRAAASHVALCPPLTSEDVPACTDALVIGGGPAGLAAATSLARAGRRVVLVERSPILGGMAVRFDEMFPGLECSACLLEPLLGELLHGPAAGRVEPLLLSEVVEVAGAIGNFRVKIRRRPRYVSLQTCIGCGLCIDACPVTHGDGRAARKAIDLEFFGGLPSVPFIRAACLHLNGETCTQCRDACPVEGTIRFDDAEEVLERTVGTVVVAAGASLYDCSRMPNLGWGRLPGVCTAFELERLLAENGPTGGELMTFDGRVPRTVAFVHCAGSLEADHVPYCSGICCLIGFKLNQIVTRKAPQVRITHFYKTLVAPGKEAFACQARAVGAPGTTMVRYDALADLEVTHDDGLALSVAGGPALGFDMVVLLPPLVPSADTARLAEVLGIGVDGSGFLEEAHARIDTVGTATRGVYVAGTCQGPKDVAGAMTQGLAAAGHALSVLQEGQMLTVGPLVARVDERRCAGCRACLAVCPYRAIDFVDETLSARVTSSLCVGCGTCVATCPAGAIQDDGFTDAEMFAEIEELLR